LHVPHRQCCLMPRSYHQVRKVPEVHDDIAFPVPYREHAKYLKLADDFLALAGHDHLTSKVIPIDQRRRIQRSQTKRVA